MIEIGRICHENATKKSENACLIEYRAESQRELEALEAQQNSHAGFASPPPAFFRAFPSLPGRLLRSAASPSPHRHRVPGE